MKGQQLMALPGPSTTKTKTETETETETETGTKTEKNVTSSSSVSSFTPWLGNSQPSGKIEGGSGTRARPPTPMTGHRTINTMLQRHNRQLNSVPAGMHFTRCSE